MTQTYKDRYRQSLEPWAVYHHLTACKPHLMSRHRNRSDADGVAQWLTRNTQCQTVALNQESDRHWWRSLS